MSTFTDWNGPQGSNVRASDLLALTKAYQDVLDSFNDYQKKLTFDTAPTAGSNNPVTSSGVKTAVDNAISTLQSALASYVTSTSASSTYATKTELSNKADATALAGYYTKTAVDTKLADYLKTNDLSTNTIITAIKADITAIETALAVSPFTKPVLKATSYVEGLIHAVEQVKFTDKYASAYVGGADSAGNYYLLGMLLDKAGTAYVKYTNTDPFSAVVNFAVTPDDKGALSVTCDNEVWDALKFKIVGGTDASSNKHTYLAVQAPDWVVSQIEFNVAGINFVPIGSEGWVAPNGNCHDIVDCYAYTGLTASQVNIQVGNIGEVVAWSKFDTNGIPKDIPANCHVCDGTAISATDWPELIALGLTNFPLVDYHIIVGKKTAA